MDFIQSKWFAEAAPVNAKSATASIGSGANGTVTITYDLKGTEGNSFEAAVVVATGNNKDMSAALVNGVVTVTLGTDASGDADATKNTAALIAAAINALDGFSAVSSGTGATAIASATEDNVPFTGGQFGTFCPVPYTYLADSTYYYFNIAPNGDRDTNWRRIAKASLTAY